MAPVLNLSIYGEQFTKNYDSALDLISQSESYLDYLNKFDKFDENDYKPYQIKNIISLAFMNVVASWENFLENMFIGYMTGAATKSGYCPVLLKSKFSSKVEACRDYTNKITFDPDVNYISWTYYTKVFEKAKVYFVNGEPFTKLNQLDVDRISDAVIIRNRIAHESKKCVSQFLEVADKHHAGNQSLLPSKDEPGSFLIERCNNSLFQHLLNPDDSVVCAFMDTFARCVQTICPSK